MADHRPLQHYFCNTTQTIFIMSVQYAIQNYPSFSDYSIGVRSINDDVFSSSVIFQNGESD
jgi:hypothetical protein